MTLLRDNPAPAIDLEHVACPKCGADDSVLAYRARDWIYGVPGEYYAARCRKCGLFFQNPRPLVASLAACYPDNYAPHGTPPAPATPPATSWQSELRAGWRCGYLAYGLGYQHLADATGLRRSAARLASVCSYSSRWQADVDLIPRFVPNGRLLEIGCGSGAGLYRLQQLGWKHLQGVELAAAGAEAARRLGFEVITAPIEEALDQFPDQHFDVVVSSMVIEHLLNPFATVRAIARKIKPHGQFLFSTVIRDSLDGSLFGPYGVSNDFPRHMVFFRKQDLFDMLAADFDRVRCVHQNTPIDFERPARMRNNRFDQCLLRLIRVPGITRSVWLLAQLGLMGRVSFRCRRRPQRH